MNTEQLLTRKLTDEELDYIAGGYTTSQSGEVRCQVCGKIISSDIVTHLMQEHPEAIQTLLETIIEWNQNALETEKLITGN